MSYELFIALRYLRARRRRFLSVVSAMAVIGITVGVWALVSVLAFQSGMEQELRGKILAGTAHLNVLRRGGKSIENLAEVKSKVAAVPGVKAVTATTYKEALISGATRSVAGVLKAVDLAAPPESLEVSRTLLPGGKIADLARKQYGDGTELEGIILGKRLAEEANVKVGETVQALVPQGRGELSPAGMLPEQRTFRVVGIFESGLYEYDSAWAYISLDSARAIAGEGDGATVLQITLADLYQYRTVGDAVKNVVGKEYVIEDWASLNSTAFAALNLQRLAFSVVITLIIVVAALNIVTTLILLVAEKKRDIAILTAMGATPRAMLTVFVAQGLALGAIGTCIGGILGIATSILCDRYHLIQLDARIYSIAAVPFRLSWADTAVVIVIALGVSLLATIYPAWRAARLDPAEGLRNT
jgi:lipoprotein-releasing system permease protein